jgi:hypothetical protein
MLRCRLCAQEFEELPEGAVEIIDTAQRGYGYTLWKFPDGRIHDLVDVEKRHRKKKSEIPLAA